MSSAARLALHKSRLATLAGSHGRRGLVFLAHFGAAKAVAYLGPLALAALLPARLYGAIEAALSVALLAALFAGLGLTLAVPRLTLQGKAMPVADLLATHVAVAGAVFFALAGLCWRGGFVLAALALTLTIVALASAALGSFARSHSMRGAAVWSDSLLTIAAVVVGLAVLGIGQARIEAVTVGAAMVGAAVLAVAVAMASARPAAEFAARYRRATALGLPMLGYSAVTLWIAVSARLVIGAILGAADVALFSFEFRVASVLLVLHAVVSVGLFARIYKTRTSEFDRLGALYVALIGLVAVLIGVASPRAARWIPAGLVAAGGATAAPAIFPLVLAQAFGWAVGALLESRVNRFGLAGRASLGSLLVAAATLAIIGGLAKPGLESLCLLLCLQWMAHNAVQIAVLAERRLWMPRLAAAIALGHAGLLSLALLS